MVSRNKRNKSKRLVTVQLQAFYDQLYPSATNTDVNGTRDVKITDITEWVNIWGPMALQYKVNSLTVEYIPLWDASGLRGVTGFCQVPESGGMAANMAQFLEEHYQRGVSNLAPFGRRFKKQLKLGTVERAWRDKSQESDIIARFGFGLYTHTVTAGVPVGQFIVTWNIAIRL